MLLCELLVLILTGHNITVDAESGTTLLRNEGLYEIIQLTATNMHQQTHINLSPTPNFYAISL